MSKEKSYTYLMCILSLIIILGGWFLTKGLLEQKEAEVLSVRGKVMMETFDSAASGEFEGEELTEVTMIEILHVWESAGREAFHEPLEGQINMEQAMETGREWIRTLAENQVLPEELSEEKFKNIHAVLSTPENQTSLEQNLVSYWTVTYQDGDVEIILKIHALSGRVWGADISMWESQMPTVSLTDEEVLAIAFPSFDKVYGRIKRSGLMVNSEEPIIRLQLNLTTDIRTNI